MTWPYPKDTKLKLIRRAKYNKETSCLEWQRAKDSFGYGHIWIYSSNRKTHRVALELKLKRPIKAGLECQHDCHNKSCISTAQGHVKEGTHLENMANLSNNARKAVSKGPSEAFRHKIFRYK